MGLLKDQFDANQKTLAAEAAEQKRKIAALIAETERIYNEIKNDLPSIGLIDGNVILDRILIWIESPTKGNFVIKNLGEGVFEVGKSPYSPTQHTMPVANQPAFGIEHLLNEIIAWIKR